MTSIAAPPLVAAAADALRSAMRGPVLVSSDAGYDRARRVWNGAVDRYPAVIARCADEPDVVAAVRVARDLDLPLSVRGGGHDWAGRAVRDGGVLIDMSGLRAVRADPLLGVAEAQGGTLAGGLADAVHERGLVPVTGTVRQVGIAGITMAGGYGPLIGSHGLVLDNLLGARVVLADGTAVTASAAEHPDLFWALRGGGGNFGVVTEMRFRVHPQRTLLSGMVLFPLSAAPAVLSGYREVTAAAPDELSVIAAFFAGPDGAPLCALMPTWYGDAAQGERRLAELRDLAEPVFADLGPRSVPQVLDLLTAVVVDGRHNETDTRWLPEMSPEAAALLIDAAEAMTSPYSVLAVHHFHGAATRVGVADTAYGLRREHLLVEIIATWEPDGPGEPHRAWMSDLSTALAGLALPGGYPNLLGPAQPHRVWEAYGPNAARLRGLKRQYDPANVFSAVPTLSSGAVTAQR